MTTPTASARERALIIGGTGQVGSATARALSHRGYTVAVAHRGHAELDPQLVRDGVREVVLDRDDTAELVHHARGCDLVVDAVAYTPAHADQLALLAGSVGSLVVISTASVYLGSNGAYLDTSTGPHDFPDLPVPVTEDQQTIESDDHTYSAQKAAMERRLLETDDLPVSILRPGAIHGRASEAPREWYFIRRALDGRTRVALAYNGESIFSTTGTQNLAHLISLCGATPGRRVLNAVDTENHPVVEIGRRIFTALGREYEPVGFDGAPVDGIGATPWSVPRPFALSMRRAHDELGYTQAVSYSDAVADDIRWVLEAVGTAEENGGTWRDAFPVLRERYGADGWFDYESEDRWLQGR
ncbi:NAD(P)H-binding protein [Okibacterium endophyticum]